MSVDLEGSLVCMRYADIAVVLEIRNWGVCHTCI